MLEQVAGGKISGRPNDNTIAYRNELQFRQLLEKLPAGAYTCNNEGLITYFNQHAEQLWGRKPALNDPTDRFCGSFKLFSADEAPIMHDECWMALALQQNAEFNGHEIIIERPDGSRLTALAHANPIRDDDGTLLGAVNVLVDISDRKESEKILMEADRAKNEFLATLAHELRNPLAPIRNAIEILHLKDKTSPELKWALDVVDRQMTQMTRLVDDLLDLARITSNRIELRSERIELSAVLNAAVEISRPLIESRGHEFTVDLPNEPVMIDGDLTRLAQAVSNLLNNAAKYTENGGAIRLEAEAAPHEAVIEIHDTGIGIAAAMMPRIFEMFTQVENSTEASHDGLGVGLTLVKKLIEMHGGTVEANSGGAGKGSTFVVRLPVASETANQRSTELTEANSVSDFAPRRILIVDDNRDCAESLGVLLRLTGHEVCLAYDGEEALKAAAAFQPDVAFLDIGMPLLNGYEAARRLRAQQNGNDLLLIAVTGWGQDEDRRLSKEAGFDHHLTKPIEFDNLQTLLSEKLQTKASA